MYKSITRDAEVRGMETEGVWVNEGDVEFWKYGGNLCRFSPDS